MNFNNIQFQSIKIESIHFANGSRMSVIGPNIYGIMEIAYENLQILSGRKIILNDYDLMLVSDSIKQTAHPDQMLVGGFLFAITDVLEGCGHFIQSKPLTINHNKHEGKICLSFCCPSPDVPSFMYAIKFLDLIISNGGVIASDVIKKTQKQLLTNIKSRSPAGFNTIHLLKTATNKRLPVLKLTGNIYQIGYGKFSCRFDSSFSEQTSKISSDIVKDKLRTSALLRRLSFPVAQTRAVANSADAVMFCNRIKQPIVLKPMRLDGGVGVRVNLSTEIEIRTAFDEIKKISKHIIAEAYFQGVDYRVQVVDGVVHGVIKRMPASIIGDGKRTVTELVDIVNRERKNATDDRKYLHPILIDQEAIRILKKQKADPSFVPKEGQLVRLTAASNVATGGHPVQIPVSSMHLDNIKLCVDICRLLRIDIAGIDLIIPDIERSWKECGAHICEVNSQPQMFTTLFDSLIESKIPNSNKIPIFLIYKNSLEKKYIGAISAALRKKYKNLALVADGIVVEDDIITETKCSALREVEKLLFDKDVDAVAVIITSNVDLNGGWPFSYCDYFVYDDKIPKALHQDVVSTLDPGYTLELEGEKDICDFIDRKVI